MKRRGFFGALLALVAAPKAAQALAPVVEFTTPWIGVDWGCGESRTALSVVGVSPAGRMEMLETWYTDGRIGLAEFAALAEVT